MLPTLALAAALACAPPAPGQQEPADGAPPAVAPQKILSPDLAPGDIFGAALAVDGDVMLLAAEYDDDQGKDSGAVWAYRYREDRWEPEQKLMPDDGQAGDNFGRAVSLDANVALIGAHWDDDNGSRSGSAYVFRHDGTAWTQVQKLLAPDGAADDRFGTTLALDGDRLLVGAWRDNDRGPGAGSVYSFRRDDDRWVMDQKLLAADGSAGAGFARYVSLSGEVALIGASHDAAQGKHAGAAYVFRHDGERWVQQQKLLPPDVSAGDQFGWATALDQDVAIVGSHGDDEAAENAGAVYVFRDHGDDWVLEQKVIADDAAAFNQLGYSIALRGEELLLGAKSAQGTVNTVGKAYVFRRAGDTWQQSRVLEPPDGQPFGAFAFHVDLDARTRVIGAWRDEAGVGPQAGAVYVWTTKDS